MTGDILDPLSDIRNGKLTKWRGTKNTMLKGRKYSFIFVSVDAKCSSKAF